MTRFYIFTALLLTTVGLTEKSYGNDDSHQLRGPYLGQEPPKMTPKRFAPEIVSTEHRDYSAFFSPDMREFYFTRKLKDSRDWSLVSYKFKNDEWKESDVVPRVGRPFISPDGKTMHLGKRYKELTDSGWSGIKELGKPYQDIRIMRLTSSLKGTYVLDEATREGNGQIRYSKLVNGTRSEPQPFSKAINTGKWNAHPFIAPDESYIMWDGVRDSGYGQSDIFISFKQQDGSWGDAVNLGNQVNTESGESGPYVTPDGKYLFFNRKTKVGDGDIYWVGAKVIEDLKLKSQTSNNIYALNDYPLMKGPYMGQKPPGMIAEPFAPGIISRKGWELEGVFAPGMSEFYYTTRKADGKGSRIIGFRQQDNTWNKYTEITRRGEVSFSPDGKRMHMAKGYKDRNGDGWSERKSLGPMFDRKDWGIMRLSASANGTYVFDDYKSGDVIRMSKIKNGKHQEPEKMNEIVNTGKWTAHPFIAPDESYLIWDSEREGGFGGSDLYISFRQKDGSWGSAINMGDNVNSAGWDAYASVTPDGKYILFNRGIDEDNVDIYWVDAKIIEELRPKS